MTIALETRAPNAQVVLPQPEPGLTPEQIIQRAVDLRPLLRADQAETEERGAYSPEMHERFKQAGFYRILQPKMFGGYEFDLTVFSKVMVEIARGCPGTGWCLTLASGHVLNVAALFSQPAQAKIFGSDGHFAAPARGIPQGVAKPVEGGWLIDGVWDYCSGVPYSTHALVSVRMEGGADGGPPQIGAAIVPRADWEMLDNWGDFIGMRASGSNSIRIKNAFIADEFLARQNVFDMKIGDLPGYKVHGNPLYAGRMFGFFQTEITSIMVGLGYAAVDEFENIIVAKQNSPVPAGPNASLDDYHRAHGLAMGRLEAAAQALDGGARSYEAYCRRGVQDVRLYTESDDMLIQAGLQQAARLAFEAVDLLYCAAGTSISAKNGTRMQRYFRDVSMARTNPGLQYERSAARISVNSLSDRGVIKRPARA
jgi:3-hydroxy-9,10-secoandrosta-1,3,5(10)-triene-9,17-dione monooxygenase